MFKIFFLHVRYLSALALVFIGVTLTIPGELVLRLGRWIGSRDRNADS